MRKIFACLLLISVCLLVACQVDFEPNDDYVEQMNVYCLLDPDDDTTFVRVEKVFFGGGNALENAHNKDSLYYGKDDLQVMLYVYNAWDTTELQDSFAFDYKQVERSSSDFYSSSDCPVYYCVTKGKLFISKYYKLVVKNLKTFSQAQAGTFLIDDYTITANNFTFNETKSNEEASNNKASYLNRKMKVQWTTASNNWITKDMYAKQFQLDIRFNYLKDSRIYSIDIPINKKTNSYNSIVNMSSYVVMADVVNAIKQQLAGQTSLAWYSTKPFEIRVLAGNLQLFDYVSINASNLNTLNYQSFYSNITGGVGLFASRRTHIAVGFTDKQIDNNLKTEIKSLGLGF